MIRTRSDNGGVLMALYTGTLFSGRRKTMESVPNEVLQDTNECPNNFSCLNIASDEAAPLCNCTVESFLGKNLMFVSPRDTNAFPCPYLMYYGNEHICQCPTHYHLAGQRK
jgi:hypothetical protein